MKNILAIISVITVFIVAGCSSQAKLDDRRIMPSYAAKAVHAKQAPAPPIKDRNLSVMYGHIQNFAATSWPHRESALFTMIGNKLSKSTVNYYQNLLDIDQQSAVSAYLGFINSRQLVTCQWFKPQNQAIHYVRGGSCINGHLNGVVEFTRRENNVDFSLWVEMKKGEAVKGVLGQSQAIRAIAGNNPRINLFHNWSGKHNPNQVEALALGELNRNFQWHGLAATQGRNSKYRIIGEFFQGEKNGWIAMYKTLYHRMANGTKFTGIKLYMLGQYSESNWQGVGVLVGGDEDYLAPNGHWVPMVVTYSLGWQANGKSAHTNGPTIKFYASKIDASGTRYSQLYSGYNQNGKRQGPGRAEKNYFGHGRTAFIGNYINSTKVGRHEWYSRGYKNSSGDWCYASDGSYGLCSAMGGSGMGKFLALAAGAALAGSSSIDGAQKLDFMTNYSVDVLTDSGGTNTRNWGNQQVKQMRGNQPTTNGGSGSSSGDRQPQIKEDTYKFACPHSNSGHSVQVPYFTTGCLTAAKNYAKVYGCNLIDEMSSASQTCQSACGNSQCLEMPKGGNTGSGDDDLEFLNNM